MFTTLGKVLLIVMLMFSDFGLWANLFVNIQSYLDIFMQSYINFLLQFNNLTVFVLF
jgi:hypothetical protein